MLAFHKRVIALHKRYPVFTNGSLKFLYGSYNCLAYGRFSRESQIAVIFNNNPYEEEIRVPVWEIGVTKQQVMRRVFATGPEGFTEEPAIYPVYSGIVTVRLQGTSAVVLVAEKGDCPGDRAGII